MSIRGAQQHSCPTLLVVYTRQSYPQETLRRSKECYSEAFSVLFVGKSQAQKKAVTKYKYVTALESRVGDRARTGDLLNHNQAF